jgi:cytochrome c oxidase subunit 2
MFANLRSRAVAGLAGLATSLTATSAMAAWDQLNMTQGVTPIARGAYDLHMLMLWICVIIGVIVFGTMFVAIVLHRKAAGREPAQFHHSTAAEIVWTIIPFVILVSFAVPATHALIDMEDTSESDLTIKVTGYQWLWKYDYIEDDVSFYSKLASSSREAIYSGDPADVENYLLEVDEPVVMPVGKKVRLLITADDVIHAWWVPAFGMKKDAIPGYVNEMWVKIDQPGTYRGQCAELCGKDHGFMPIVVEAKPEAEYKQWVAAYKAEQKTRLAAATLQNQ